MRTSLGLLALTLCACSSATPAPQPPRSVSIDATATLHLPPDTAAVHLTFGTIEDDLATAHQRVEGDRSTFLSEVERFDSRVETGVVQYSRYRPSHATIDRYRASQGVVVHTPEFDDIPRIIALAGRGLTGVSVRYYVADMVQHRTRLREMAIEAAHTKANELALGFDSDLGQVLTIEERGATANTHAVGNFDNTFARVEAPDGSGPPPGSIPLQLTLRLSFELS